MSTVAITSADRLVSFINKRQTPGPDAKMGYLFGTIATRMNKHGIPLGDAIEFLDTNGTPGLYDVFPGEYIPGKGPFNITVEGFKTKEGKGVRVLVRCPSPTSPQTKAAKDYSIALYNHATGLMSEQKQIQKAPGGFYQLIYIDECTLSANDSLKAAAKQYFEADARHPLHPYSLLVFKNDKLVAQAKVS